MDLFEVTGVKIQDKLEISCDRKQENVQRLMRVL